MRKVAFYDADVIPTEQLRYCVIVSRSAGKWVYCRHRDRATWECPSGHREPGETPEACARRELWEETGADRFMLEAVGVYGVTGTDGTEIYGGLYLAEIFRFSLLPPLEIAEIRLFDEPPAEQTYPEIQPVLLKKIREHCKL